MAKKPFVLQIAVFSALRRLFRRFPGYQEVLNRCKSEHFVPTKKGTKVRRVLFKCEACGERVKRELFAVDHIEPVVPVEGLNMIDGFPDLNQYKNRLFCDTTNLQGLCKTCHDLKTKLENKIRRDNRKAKQDKPGKKTPAKRTKKG